MNKIEKIDAQRLKITTPNKLYFASTSSLDIDIELDDSGDNALDEVIVTRNGEVIMRAHFGDLDEVYGNADAESLLSYFFTNDFFFRRVAGTGGTGGGITNADAITISNAQINDRLITDPAEADNNNDIWGAQAIKDYVDGQTPGSETKDPAPTAGSTNAVESQGIKTALDAKADTTTVNAALAGKANTADLHLPETKGSIEALGIDYDSLSNKPVAETKDNTPSAGSSNAVESQGIKTELDKKLNNSAFPINQNLETDGSGNIVTVTKNSGHNQNNASSAQAIAASANNLNITPKALDDVLLNLVIDQYINITDTDEKKIIAPKIVKAITERIEGLLGVASQATTLAPFPGLTIRDDADVSEALQDLELYHEQLYDWLIAAGPIRSGAEITRVGANYQVVNSPGSIVYADTVTKRIVVVAVPAPADPFTTFDVYIHRDGPVLTDITRLDTNMATGRPIIGNVDTLDVNDPSLGNVNGNNASIHRWWLKRDGTKFALQIGQTEYNAISGANGAIAGYSSDQMQANPNLLADFIQVAAMLIRADSDADLDGGGNIPHSKIVPASKFGELGRAPASGTDESTLKIEKQTINMVAFDPPIPITSALDISDFKIWDNSGNPVELVVTRTGAKTLEIDSTMDLTSASLEIIGV